MHNAGIMNHLGQQHCGVFTLENLHIVVVQARHKRWSRVKSDNAALRQSPVFRSISADASRRNTNWPRVSCGATPVYAPLYDRPFRHGWQPSVGGGNNVRGSHVATNTCILYPEIIIGPVHAFDRQCPIRIGISSRPARRRFVNFFLCKKLPFTKC